MDVCIQRGFDVSIAHQMAAVSSLVDALGDG